MIYTIGHSTREAGELVDLLRRNGVELLVDVRRYPVSRRHPQFTGEALAATVESAGIAYAHVPELGGRRGSESAAGGSGNAGWRNASFRAYADHMASPAFRAALARVESESATRPLALMCAEAVPWRCHRQLIADALVLRGHEVRHIISLSPPTAHEPNPLARPGPGGIPRYPPAAPAQPDLFEE